MSARTARAYAGSVSSAQGACALLRDAGWAGAMAVGAIVSITYYGAEWDEAAVYALESVIGFALN